MRDAVFVDTSAFVALRNEREREHEAARRALLVRVGRDEAIAWGRGLRASTAVELLRIDEELEEEAWSILEAHADKRWSYVDSTSFALMSRERLTVAFSFDRDFAQRGLALVPASRAG